MAQVVVRNLEDDVHEKLRALAIQHRMTIEETVKAILSDAVCKSQLPLGARLAKRFAEQGLDFEIQELRENTVQPLSLDS